MKKILFVILTLFTSNFVEAQLQANFHCTGSGYDNGCGGFGDSSIPGSSPIVSWNWDFGNGNTSTLQDPYEICYDSIGSYTVCLTITDANGISNAICKANYMTRDSLGTHCTPFSNILELSDLGIILNQNSDYIDLKMENINSGFLEFNLMDLTGRLIQKERLKNTMRIYIGDIGNGIYLCILRNERCQKVVRKIIKN